MISPSPVEQLLRIELNWSLASSSSVGQLYGRMIHKALSGRPIGLIATSWDGTPIEVWMSPKA
jgi:sialate O-acetylesterase